jgi:hypothetical protein
VAGPAEAAEAAGAEAESAAGAAAEDDASAARADAGDEDDMVGRTKAATPTAATTAAAAPIRARRRADPGLRWPAGESGGVLIGAGLYWARSHAVSLKILARLKFSVDKW